MFLEIRNTMTYRPDRMSFGIFLAPFHKTGQNPTLALDRDMALIEHLDRLGFDEVWIGEHHSAGWELIADPGLVIAALANRTRTIRLGTGVTSLPYHHPLIVADRMVQLDHMTRGRAMFGVGPGALTSDAYMLGIDATKQREMMMESLEAIVALLKAEEPVNMTTDWFTLRDARLQIASYTRPHLPIAVAHGFSPAGPMAAGQFGAGLLSMAAFQPGALVALPEAWNWAMEQSQLHGTSLSRDDWRLVIPVHLAESRERAIDEVREGSYAYNVEYFGETLGRTPSSDTESIESMIERGGAIVGTPDDAIEFIEGLIDLTGGFGGFMGLAHEWAEPEATFRSYELWARFVMPHFQNMIQTTQAGRDWVSSHRDDIFSPRAAVTRKAFDDANVELPEGMEDQMQRGKN